jgi:hypothetical protein
MLVLRPYLGMVGLWSFMLIRLRGIRVVGRRGGTWTSCSRRRGRDGAMILRFLIHKDTEILCLHKEVRIT